ncbi:MAG: carboxypeptidase-like regulatory domain-containing protein [Thermoanaerobaculales bacterium]|nr:carboxypeptidase-like regulatory domain-containing protein [Thermoanaerobaculales bacterium]
MRKFYVGIGLLAALALLAAPQAAWAQSSQSTGQVIGSVNDAGGGVLPGVMVEAKNADTGFRRTAITDGAGFFRLDLLPSGVYDVRAELAGFKTEIQKGVTVSLGSSVRIDYLMAASTIEEEIVVTAQAPIIETTNPSVAASVGEESIQNLPLQGRDFKDFAILVPGTVGADDSQQSSRGGLHIGARAIQNSFNIDGSNSQSSFFGEERGGTRPPFTFSQAAIKESQVVKSDTTFSSTPPVVC